MDTNRYLRALFISFTLLAGVANATEYTSDNFQVLDPVQFPGGFSSSASFRLFDALAQISIGTSTSGSYEVRSGFLYFPAPTPTPASTPAPTPTPTGIPGGGGIPGFGQPPIFKLPVFLFPEAPSVPIKIKKCGTADFNCDGVVDIADLSIFFYLDSYSPSENPADLNNDSSIDLADTSIVFYYWTENKIFNLAKNIALGYEPPFAEKAGGGRSFSSAKPSPKTFSGFQEEESVTAEVFGVFDYIKAAIAGTVDMIVSFISQLFSFLW